ncbi:unnamed protein product [Rotaria socialis]|uniref:Metalloreductase STEAP2 n=1 Tax=Rotaria socialis TaxID=392032 RepID=A0A817XPW4_9BILA|nr:unnamed protein product [Rotaria socialis]CAF3370740.1 unnamed protein product [Rotaria socialis]CAF4254914.1 unnamed protein product [Rotaria socialis]CAF4915334.1 unnamed protein product [Rotaria socialis]
MTDPRCIGIIGCGDMGFALAHRLTHSGFTVLMGSRDPKNRRHLNYEITSITDCIHRSFIIFIATHAEHYTNVLISPLEHNPTLFDRKIVIDISNQQDQKTRQDDFSNAERLQIAIPSAYIVKAFNTISSFVMQNTTAGEPRSVPVASDHSLARDKVMMLAREMNFESYNSGSLRAARHLETYTRTLFPGWIVPIIIAIIVLFGWLIYTLLTKFIYVKTTSWDQLFLHMTNKVLCASAITMLSLVYMPSNLACIFQLAYGNKEKRFPTWLDKWLLSRKQLGLLTFAISLFHVLSTLVLMSPGYYKSWFHPAKIIISANRNQTEVIVPHSVMTIKGELASLMGILTLLLMSLLAITSIPAIANLLNWREWRFIQSKLGTFTLLLAIGHAFAMAIPRWIAIGFVQSLRTTGFHCVVFPVITILLKFVLCLPCFARPIRQIRHSEKPKHVV